MATPRKSWFRVADQVAEELWTNDELATLTRLGAKLNIRWARNGLTPEQVGDQLFGPGDLLAIAGCLDPEVALERLKALEALVSLTIAISGRGVRVRWPKFAEFQQYDPRFRGSPRAEPAPGKPRGRPGTALSAPAPAPAPTPPPPDSTKPDAEPPAHVAEALDEKSVPGQLARRLCSEVHRVYPKAKLPKRLLPWAVEIDRMIRLDERDPTDIVDVIQWLYNANQRHEAAFLVLSAGALRAKFDRIQAIRARQGGARTTRTDAVSGAIKEVLDG